MKKFRHQLLSSTVSAAALPTIAFAAVVQRALQDDVGTIGFWGAFVAVQALTAAGYGASSLPKWGGWRDKDSTAKLTLYAGVLGAVLAGNMSYYLGLYYFHYEQIACLAASIGGGFLGEKALAAYFEKFVGRMPQTQPEKP